MSSSSIDLVVGLGERVDLTDAYTTIPPPRNDIIYGLEPGYVGVIGGRGGASKSWLLLQTAHDLALAGAVDALSTRLLPTDARPQRVVYFALEEMPNDLKRRVHTLGTHLNDDQRRQAAESIELRSARGLVLQRADGTLDTHKIDALTRVADKSGALILEPTVRTTRANLNEDGAAAELICALEGVAQKGGCIIVLACHASKASSRDGRGDEVDAIKGSTAITDLARWARMMYRLSDDDRVKRALPPGFYRVLGPPKANHIPDAPEILFRVADGGILDSSLPPNSVGGVALSSTAAEAPATARTVRIHTETQPKSRPTFDEYAARQ